MIMLKGKTTRNKPNTIQDIRYVPIPRTIKDNHPDIKLSVDYMYIQGIPMLHTIAKNYKFCTIEAYPDRKKANKEIMIKGITKVTNMYKARDLPVVQINADNEFSCIREEVRPATMNIVAADEHVGDIEHSIRMVKEGARCHVQLLPYKRCPKQMVIACVIYVIKCLNEVPDDNGISDSISPGTLISGVPGQSYKEIMKINFGDYVQVYNIQGGQTSGNEPRTIGAIALYPSENAQGGWYFMSLLIG